MADFDARLRAPADMARRRPRGLAVITGVAAAVAVGFIVAAAVGLFAERESDIAAPPPAPAPAPSVEAADAAAPPAAPEPPPPAESPAEALAVPTTGAPQAFLAPPPAAAPLPALEPAAAQADAEAAMAEAEEASAAQAEAAAAQPAPAPEPPPPAADEAEVLDDAGPEGIVLADPPPEEACTAAIGDRTVELRLTVGGTPILILGASDGSLTGLDGTTCTEIPAPDASEVVADEAPDGCAATIGDGTVELRLTFSGTRVLVIRATDGSLSALDGTTCGAIPTG